jgi:RNA ligase (TIGR02306 family)
VRKGQFKTGDLAAYVPEQSVLPNWLIERLGLVGRLSGAEKNRVKAIKLRGVLSQGLVVDLESIPDLQDVKAEQDVTANLGIVKWEPPVPARMASQVWHAGARRCVRYDIENFKMYPDAF